VIKTQPGRATEKSFFGQVTIETFDSRIANASDDLGCGVTLAARMEAREGEFPRADAQLLFALQEAGGGALEERRFYCAKDGITAGSAILKVF